MDAKDIIRNLQLVGEELESMKVQDPVELLLIGGGFMLTQIQNRTATSDVDVMVLRPDVYTEPYQVFKEAVKFVAQDERLDPAWLSTNIGDFLRIAGPLPSISIWKIFGPLQIYIPPKNFVLALKLVAGRKKDMDDIDALCRSLHVTTRHQAQTILNAYISLEVQTHSNVEGTLDLLAFD